MNWEPIATAPKDAGILVYREGRIYVASWREGWNTWGVSAERIPGEPAPFTDIGEHGFGNYIAAAGPTHWMPLPKAPV